MTPNHELDGLTINGWVWRCLRCRQIVRPVPSNRVCPAADCGGTVRRSAARRPGPAESAPVRAVAGGAR